MESRQDQHPVRRAALCLLLVLAVDAVAADCGQLTARVQAHARKDAAQGRAEETAHSLEILYGQNAAACNRQIAEIVDIYRTAYVSALPKRGWWQEGWIAAAVLAVLLLFRDFLLKIGAAALEWLRRTVYNRFAGSRLFRRTAIRRYRNALHAKYEHLVVAFRPDIKLKMRDIYVPVRTRRTVEESGRDAIVMISRLKRTMVVGPPGSGKSMLMRSVAFQFSERGDRDRTIPVLVELNRFNEGATSVFDTVVDILRLNDFPRAENFVRAALERGDLFLLFDGLDEVNTDRRDLVAQSITDFLDEHEKCRAMITCRNQVYRNEFAALVDDTLEVVEFDDFQIRRLLTSWQPYLPADKSVDQLIQTLRTRPRIMALARNPLLLTIVAFLYTEPSFALPHSRAEFYDQAIDALLLPKGKRNRYKAPHKKLVLQHLALFNHDSGTANQGDRRTIELPQVIQEIKKVLPTLNLKDDEADSMLDEIVERSGLLLSIDGGARVAFAHLTLQEFFAAGALSGDAPALIGRFEADRDGWREVAKLWCGFDHDSTKLISAIYMADPITAFECLADAQKIDPSVADRIVKSFEKRVEAGETDEAIGRAFGALAADPRPRGAAAFAFLTKTLDRGVHRRNRDIRVAAAEALAATNLPAAAQHLAERAARDPDVRPALLSLGDLAVLPLSAGVLAPALACRMLYEIGTPQAAAALVAYLDSGVTAAPEAAWYLCGLLRRPEIEEALRAMPLPANFAAHARADWVWAPYGEPASSSLAAIVGRSAALMLTHPPQEIEIDPRIAVPLAIKAAEVPTLLPGTLAALVSALETATDPARSRLARLQVEPSPRSVRAELEQHQSQLISSLLDQSVPLLGVLLRSVPVEIRLDFLRVLSASPTPTTRDWTTLFDPRPYRFETGIHLKILLLMGAALTVAAFFAARATDVHGGWMALWTISTFCVAMLLLNEKRLARFIVVDERLPLPWRYLFAALGPAMGLVFYLGTDLRDKDALRTGLALLARSTPLWLWMPLNLYFVHRFLASYGTMGVLFLWGGLVFAIVSLLIFGYLAEQRATNPLRRLLDHAREQSLLGPTVTAA
jgi:energy-coupling factor transporter ATP-binding protein EcfA2